MRQTSQMTREKISASLKVYHEKRNTPSPEELRRSAMQEAFSQGCLVQSVVRHKHDIAVEEIEAQSRNATQDNALTGE